jgi:50S ribosomal subunit-associated GTPase HflX
VTTRALVICPSLAREPKDALRSPEARRDEAVGLARAIDLKVVGAESISLNAIRPATFIGKGKVDTIAVEVRAEGSILWSWTARYPRRSSATSRKPSAARSSTAPG